MSKKTFLLLFTAIFVSLACALSTTGAPQNGSSPIPPGLTTGGTPQKLSADNQGGDLPASPDLTEPGGRSAGIDLLPGASGTATPDVPPTQAPQAELPLYPHEWYPLNASGASGDLSVTVLGWGLPTKDESGDDKPASGLKFVWIDVVFYNRGSAYQQVWWGLRGPASVKDDAGEKYDVTNLYFIYEKKETSRVQIAPGEHLRRELFFAVPENVAALTFQYALCSDNKILSDQCDQFIAIPLAKVSAGGVVPPEINSPDPGAHALGELITQGDFTFSAVRWEVMPPSEQTSNKDIPRGINFVKVGLAVANMGQQKNAMNATGSLWVSLKDSSGRYFETASSSFGPGQISPGEWAQGQYFFQVPPGTAGLELVVDAIDPVKRWPTFTRIFISLGDQPALAATSLEQMPGSLALNAIPLGQPGQLGAYQFAVKKVDFPNTSFCSDIKPGQRAVLLTVSELNTGSSTITGYDVWAFLKDSQGNYHGSCYSEDDGPKVGELAAGATRMFQYSFIIPDVPGDLWLVQYNFMSKDNGVFFILK